MFRFGISPVESLLSFGHAVAPSYGWELHSKILQKLTAQIQQLQNTADHELCGNTQARLQAIQGAMDTQKELQQKKVLLTL